MSEHLTEEEQIESFKRWWSENGKSTVITLVLVVSGYLGWGGWQTQQQQQSEAASATYQQMLDVIQENSPKRFDEVSAATAKHLAETLKAEHANSLYASQAALFLAKLAVLENDFDGAAVELQWVLDAGVDTDLLLLARARLARVKFAQEDYDTALAVLETKDSGAFKSTFAEIRGDILLAKGEQTSARAAYQLALGSLTSDQQSRRALIQIKLTDLQLAPVVEMPVEQPVAEENNS